jgi:CubicO group peptidase (beta-lactamase class C family)
VKRASPRHILAAALALGHPGARADPIDAAVAAQMARHHIPGLSLAVVQDGAVVKAAGYGTTAGAGSAPVTANTLFIAGSVSKPVAAMGALRLVEAGKLSLDTDVNAALRVWKVPENAFTADSKVTLRRILSHSAGLTVHGFRGYGVGELPPTLVQVLDGAGNSEAVRVDLVPGTKWRYSGGGYTVMQELVVEVTGKSFPAFMREAVLDPLGMASSSFEQPMPAARAARAACGYTSPGVPVPGGWHVYPEMAAAGLWTTASDLARFVIGLQNAYSGRSNPVLSQKMAREMVTIQTGDDGLGVFIRGQGPSRRFEHNGVDEGFDTMMVGYVERGQGAVVMININDDSRAVSRIVEAIADSYGWPDYPHFKPAPPIEDGEPAVTAQIKAVFEASQAGKIDRSLFTARLADLIETSLSGPLGQRLRGYGPLRSIAVTGRETHGLVRVYRYRIEWENDTIDATATYDSGGRIAGLAFQPE